MNEQLLTSWSQWLSDWHNFTSIPTKAHMGFILSPIAAQYVGKYLFKYAKALMCHCSTFVTAKSLLLVYLCTVCTVPNIVPHPSSSMAGNTSKPAFGSHLEKLFVYTRANILSTLKIWDEMAQYWCHDFVWQCWFTPFHFLISTNQSLVPLSLDHHCIVTGGTQRGSEDEGTSVSKGTRGFQRTT